ncbi:MAG: AAA family ATPase [Syntrophotaleaceae bacterium]
MILTLLNIKGGVGKTTLAFLLSVAMARRGRDILLLDTDPQGSASDSCAIRLSNKLTPEISCVSLCRRDISQEVRRLSRRYQDIVIDVGGRDSPALRSSLVVADKAIIPILPAQFDAWALEEVEDLIRQARGFNSRLKALVVINKADTNPAMKFCDALAEHASSLEELDLVRARLGYRVAYRRAPAEGKGLDEISPKDPLALAEFHGFYEEVVDVE